MNNSKEIEINNRRYIGSKTNLLNDIDSIIKKYFNNYDFTIADIFGGTGVVANYFYNKGANIIINDNLYSNYVAYQTWLSNKKYNMDKIKKIIDFYNSIEPSKLESNYFSKVFGNKYFHENDAKKIGYIREDIEKRKHDLTEREYYILLTSLMYETDKIANTVGHFESFLKKAPTEKEVYLRIPKIQNNKGTSEIYCEDSNKLVRKIKADIFYVDPPYNARQYVNFYHVLENLARWEKPTDLEGNSMKFKRDNLKSEYSRSKAPVVFKDLIDNIDGKLIIVSYNNTYDAKSGASNNKITEEQLINILKSKGKVSKVEINYKFFNAGKTDLKNHKEFLFICEVDR